ncbi:hypothetical protein WAI453_008742 [Rhynchosporium graminicola]|uniref:Vacuolar membrane protein n=1 Tax=Rhynchosporium graminicola TaxID=2792576 RepID=A0A1E1KHY9_9HELO|nr:uncharacterized protein RCO7_00134 [Rhynchosporium commune]
MGCSGRVKADDIRPEQKWDFISLNDFHSGSCIEFFAYGYLWISLLVSLAVYGVDTFTAVNLLAFDKWSGTFDPPVAFDIQKWIFAGCIIASWVNLGYEHLRAMRVMKRGAVAESYLDSLAIRLQSIRQGKGRGWRRFLVFSELTKSKKGAEYVALFTYFSFQSWIRIILCQGPRQVLNALTLWSVVKANIPGNSKDAGGAILTFFENLGKLAEENNQQAVVLSGMAFTLVIWVFGALSLLLSALFYLFFLWHYIPNADGGLSGYCERKINLRLASIVSVKVNKALEEEERKRNKMDAKLAKKGEKPLGRQATLPTMFDSKTSDNLPPMPMLNRNDTMTTLPTYSSRPGTPSGHPGLELDHLDQKRPGATRNVTGSSFGSNAPLVGNASGMGYARSGSPAPSLAPLNTNGYPAPPQRTMTANSTTSSNWNRGPEPPRMPSAMGDRAYTASPMSYEGGPSMTGSPMDAYGRPIPRAVGNLRSNTPSGPAPSMGRRTPFDQGHGSNFSQGSIDGRNSPAPTSAGYQAYNPSIRSGSPGPGTPNFPNNNTPQHRNMTDPTQRGPGSRTDYFGSPAPPLGPRGAGGSNGIAGGIARLASPAPYNQSPNFMGPGAPSYRR